MNILEIDAINFAGRVAHVAAAELAGLLVHGDVRPEVGWFIGAIGAEAGDGLTEEIDRMADYVAKRLCSGETLYRAFRRGDWADREPWLRMSYDLFAATVAGVSSKLLADQRRAEEEAARAKQAKPAGLKLEDSIFEPEEGLGAMRPEAVAAQKLVAAYEKAKAREARIQRKLEAAKQRKEKADAELKKVSAEATSAHEAVQDTLVDGKPPAAPAPPMAAMSVGEAPASPPVNRGGRGNKKQR